jgi:hypothetical protein
MLCKSLKVWKPYETHAQSNTSLQKTKHCISIKHNLCHNKMLSYLHGLSNMCTIKCLAWKYQTLYILQAQYWKHDAWQRFDYMYISSTIFAITKCYAIFESLKILSNMHKQMSHTSKARSENTGYFVYLSSTKNRECALKNWQAHDYFAKLVKKWRSKSIRANLFIHFPK